MSAAVSPGVRRIVLDADGAALSALLCEPEHGPARAVVVALHGGGTSASYFDGQADPDQSLLTLGARLGYTVLAVDRPGYRGSAGQFPDGQRLADQAGTVRAALRDFTARHAPGAGLFLLGHSLGGKLALGLAADPDGLDLVGLDVSGCGHEYAVDPRDIVAPGGKLWRHHWGPVRLYPPDTFRAGGQVVAPMPDREKADAIAWAEDFAALAPRVRVPLRLTFAEYEAWWRHDDRALSDLAARFTAAPRVLVDRQPQAGHNISLGWAARPYHLRALAFLADCLAARAAAGPTRTAA
ncbi:alpha/beta hydrolase [Kitasatospora sp. NPDC048298]|uniref:alpha/beta hydrolase n=1 Tax=Kitasatospora sp. NPDC048298 TaxID=3364049 RepID=UPI003715D4B6